MTDGVIPAGIVEGADGLVVDPQTSVPLILEPRAGFSPIEEDRIRLIARIAAEESARIFRPGVALGQEAAAGAGLPLNTLDVDVAARAGDPGERGGPRRSRGVLAGANPDHTLRIWGYDHRVKDLALDPCVQIVDMPVLKAQLIVAAGLVGTVRLAWSILPNAFGPPCCCDADADAIAQGDTRFGPEQHLELIDTGLGNGNTDVELPGGFKYELISCEARLACDANAATRRFDVSVFREDGITESFMFRHADSADPSEFAYVIGGPGFAASNRSLSTSTWQWQSLAWTGVLSAALNAFSFSVAAGLVGDVVTVVSRWKRWRIL